MEDAKQYGLEVPVIAAGDFNFDISQGQARVALADAGFLNPFAMLRRATTISHSRMSRDRFIDWILLRVRYPEQTLKFIIRFQHPTIILCLLRSNSRDAVEDLVSTTFL